MTSEPVKPALRGGLSFCVVAPLGAVAALVGVLWLLFSQALPGIVHFDDMANLSALGSVADLDSAWVWASQGRAGPLGRPIALITFALQYYQWPEPRALLLWNIALHLINALLVLWLAFLLAQRLGTPREKQLAAGLLTALFWASLPLLNTSTLFIIQRMTVLSATFVLMGLIAYLKVRGPADAPLRRQLNALALLGFFGALATLTKESGALIVAYGLILELSILVPKRQRGSLASAVLALGSALLLAKLLTYLAWPANVALQRGFNMAERVASQGPLLLIYLKDLFLPHPGALNPFREHNADHDLLRTVTGVALWIGLMLSPAIAWRFGWRLLALMLAWFFYGHIMESGWIQLELYFAHRNYLPAIGMVFGLIFAFLNQHKNSRQWAGALSIYFILLAGITWMNTSLWGRSDLAAEIWAKEQPQSTRAALNLAYELERTQGLGEAHVYLERFLAENRNSVGVRLTTMFSACLLNPEDSQTERVRTVKHAIATLPYEGWATDIVARLMERVKTAQCPGLTERQVADIAAAFLSRPVYQRHPSIAANMLSTLGTAALDEGDMKSAMDFYLQAIEHSVSYGAVRQYLHLTQKYPQLADPIALRAAVTRQQRPSGVTKSEWKQLLDDMDATMNTSSPEFSPHS